MTAVFNRTTSQSVDSFARRKMKNWAIIFLFSLTTFSACKKDHSTTDKGDCSQNNFQATIDSSSYQTADINTNIHYCGKGPSCPFTNIYAQRGTRPTDYHFFSIDLVNSAPGTYYLGKLGAKRDSIHLYDGHAFYEDQYSASTAIGYETDSTYNGTLTITSKDEASRIIRGTFSFTARKLMTTDTVLIRVTNGNFTTCY